MTTKPPDRGQAAGNRQLYVPLSRAAGLACRGGTRRPLPAGGLVASDTASGTPVADHMSAWRLIWTARLQDEIRCRTRRRRQSGSGPARTGRVDSARSPPVPPATDRGRSCTPGRA